MCCINIRDQNETRWIQLEIGNFVKSSFGDGKLIMYVTGTKKSSPCNHIIDGIVNDNIFSFFETSCSAESINKTCIVVSSRCDMKSVLHKLKQLQSFVNHKTMTARIQNANERHRV